MLFRRQRKRAGQGMAGHRDVAVGGAAGRTRVRTAWAAGRRGGDDCGGRDGRWMPGVRSRPSPHTAVPSPAEDADRACPAPATGPALLMRRGGPKARESCRGCQGGGCTHQGARPSPTTHPPTPRRRVRTRPEGRPSGSLTNATCVSAKPWKNCRTCAGRNEPRTRGGGGVASWCVCQCWLERGQGPARPLARWSSSSRRGSSRVCVCVCVGPHTATQARPPRPPAPRKWSMAAPSS